MTDAERIASATATLAKALGTDPEYATLEGCADALAHYHRLTTEELHKARSTGGGCEVGEENSRLPRVIVDALMDMGLMAVPNEKTKTTAAATVAVILGAHAVAVNAQAARIRELEAHIKKLEALRHAAVAFLLQDINVALPGKEESGG